MAADEDVRQFIRQHLASVWALELLLLMKRDATRVWTAFDLERELRASEALVTESLRALVRAGIVQGDGGAWRYAPMAPDLTELCARLEAAYRDSPVAIINLIAKPRGAGGHPEGQRTGPRS